ncbi:MAG: isoprenylcysteine carboxylmethyltransferase family protein [Gammaproteobacteria bacterium]|nr:isoprenylcysteine carboxylmethyltransferase family protein [Gammaproteobacteria bacterium]
MNLPMLFPLALYSLIILSLIWARFRFFKINSDASRISSLLYDPAVVLQMAYTYYSMFSAPKDFVYLVVLATILYFLSLVLFWWGITSAKQLDFAFSNNVSNIITSGPYSIVRHPFYVSYTICWLTSTLLFNSLLLWITLIYLISFYFMSARREEKVIMKSTHSAEYATYNKEVGMFLPRVTQWKSWFLRASHQKPR